MCWSTSDKPAAINVSIRSTLKSSILPEVGVVACAAARQTEERKHTCNDPICSELSWKIAPLSLSGGDIWCIGKNSRPAFCTTSSTTCGIRKFHKGYHAKFHLWQIECLVSSSQCPCFPRKVTQCQNNGPA